MKFRLILLFLLWYTCANAQVALVYDSIGEIQVRPIKDVDETNDYLRQFSLSCTDQQSNNPITLTPDAYDGYRLSSRIVYASKTFEYAGDVKRLFLRRVKTYKDSIYFYVYYNDKAELEPIYYFQTRDDDRVYPMADDPEKGYISPLRSLLLSYPMAEDPEVRAYFDKMEPTPQSFEDRHELALSKYASHLPRVKWGVLLGLAFSKVTANGYEMDPALSIVPGVFADIPFFADISYHPELIFEKYAANGTVKRIISEYNDVAYNATVLALPQLLRYKPKYLPSRVLPYFELGGQVSFNLKHSMECKYIDLGNVDTRPPFYFVEEYHDVESIPAVSFSFLAGVGFEWQFSRHHSFFVSGRFVKETGDISRTGGLLNIAYNL